MIDYKLAEELKKAGFPIRKQLIKFGEKTTDDSYWIPTLSELIDVCGEKFGKLLRTRLGDMVNWNAIESYPNTLPISHSYSTPDEAVAHLWLALHKS